MIINYLERYFYLICFATYVRQNADLGFKKSFIGWLDEHKELRGMIAEGRDRLEWTRKVDQSRVEELRTKLSGPDYKEKLGLLVSDLYKLAFQTYHDIPRGPIKVGTLLYYTLCLCWQPQCALFALICTAELIRNYKV